MPASAKLIDILRATLKRVEQGLGSDDHAFLALEGSILRAIAELEVQKTTQEESEAAKGKTANGA